MAALCIRGLAKSYGGVEALRALDLDVENGEFLALLGPSGSGKTTLLRLVAGFTLPTMGSIAIGGRNVAHLPAYKRNLGVVFQNYALFPHLTVEENVAFGLRMRRTGRDQTRSRVASTLELVGLTSLARRLPAQLSGGQQQRVALARAIIVEPDLLLLDEPLGALDLELRRQMQLEIKELHAKLGRTLVYVTHDQEEALTMADRVAVMKDGQILQMGRPRAIYETPTSRFVARFLGAGNLLTGRTVGDSTSVVLDCSAGRIPLLNGTKPPGHELTVALRPERLRLGPAAAGCGFVFEARLRSIAFRGAASAAQLILPDGTELEAVELGGGWLDSAALEPGAMIAVGLDPIDLRPLADP